MTLQTEYTINNCKIQIKSACILRILLYFYFMIKTEKIKYNQNRITVAALTDNVAAAFGKGRPADRSLSAFWREHRNCGGRDRAVISEKIYRVWRNWGRLAKVLPDGRRVRVEEGMPLTFFEAENILAAAEKLPDNLPALMPEWVAGALGSGFDIAGYAAMIAQRPPMYLRMQCTETEEETVKNELSAASLEWRSVANMPKALAVRGKVNLFTLESYKNGLFEVQDLASQQIALVCAPEKGSRWWDCCAGAGGKSLHLADLLERRGEVVASDVRSYKLEDLKKRSRRAAFPNIRTRDWDGGALRSGKRCRFDGVLVDAPCSCSGVWRRNPDGLWTAKPGEEEEMALLQRRILQNASAAVKHEGVLCYATCSVFPAENRKVVESFLADNPDFYTEEFTAPLTGKKQSDGMWSIAPSDGDCDGMFVARMRRK